MSGAYLPTGTPGPARPALKLNPGQSPAFTAADMTAYLQGAAWSSLGPTLTGEPPTVELVEFGRCKAMGDRLEVYLGLADDAPVCHVVLRGPFHPAMMSRPPGAIPYFRVCPTVEEIYDATTGRLLVTSAGPFVPRPGF